MLQIDKSRSLAVSHRAASPEYASSAEVLKSSIGFIRRQYPVILFFLLLAVGVAIVYLFIAPPRYTAQAKLMIDTRRVQLFQQQSVLGDIAVDSAAVDSQVEALKSENVALPVIKDMHLTEDPEFVGRGLAATVIGFISGLLASSQPSQPRSEFELMRSALGAFQNNLTVKRVGVTYVIDIKYQSLNPERAAQVANAVAEAYIIDQLEAKYRTTRRAATWLQDRLQELRGQASTAERAVLDFKEKNNIVDTGGRLLNEQQLAELNSSIVQARAQTAEAKARLDRTQQIISKNDLDAVSVDSTVTDTLHNDVINKLRQTYLDYRRKELEWLVKFGANHLAVVNMRNQMREIRRSILDELGRINETYKSDYEIAKAREASVEKSLASIVTQSQTTNQSQVALKELESSSQTYRALYDSFLQRYMDTVQQQSFPITEARLITEASRPLGKSSPKSLLILAVAIAGGTILGIGAAILRDISDRVFRTRRQVEIDLHTDCLAVLPFIKGGARDESILRHIADYPFSRYAESIRSIKVAVDIAAVTKPNKVIGITSSRPDEGKSTIAAALAEQMAHAGSRVILIDGDLRNGSLTRLLAPSASLGLIDIIAGKASFEEVLWSNESTNMTFLPAVVKIRVAHTSEMLASAATRKLFDRLRDSYDYVVVDLPPLAPVVDVRVTTKLIDSYLFVIEWGHTRIDVVEHSLSSAREIYDNLIGVVLNKADFSLLGRYDGARGEYYNRYDGHHGYVE